MSGSKFHMTKGMIIALSERITDPVSRILDTSEEDTLAMMDTYNIYVPPKDVE